MTNLRSFVNVMNLNYSIYFSFSTDKAHSSDSNSEFTQYLGLIFKDICRCFLINESIDPFISKS